MSKDELIKLFLELSAYCYNHDACGITIEYNGVIMNFSYEVIGEQNE